MTKSIKKNYLYNLAFQVLSIILPIITAPYLARVLGVEGVGTASYTLSIVAYFILFANLGIASFGQREIAMYQDNKKKYSRIFWDLMAYRAIIGVVTTLAYFLLILFADKYQIIYGILMINLLGNIFDISWLFQGLEEYKFISVRNIIIKLLFTISIFAFVKTSGDLNLYILLNGLSILISSLALWGKLAKTVDKPEWKKIKPFRYVKETFIYFLPQVATTIYTVLDRTMLGLFDTNQIENGYYEQAYKIISVATTVVTSINIVMLPRISFLYKKNNIEEIKTRIRKSMRFVNLTTIPLVFGTMAIASTIVPWFFGDGYEKVATILPVFSPIILIIAISSCVSGQCLTPCGMRLKSAIALWIGAALNLGCNLILIPRMMSEGAVVGSLVAEITITILYLYFARKYISVTTTFKDAIKYFIAAILMYFAVVVIKGNFGATISATVIEALVGAAVYALVLIILKDKMVLEYIELGKEKLLRRGKK